MAGQSDTITVLHVDDDPDFADLAARFIERQSDGIQVETATGVEEAIGRLEQRAFDCIVSDYDMAGQNGIEFLETVRQTDWDLPFILYTGKGSEELAGEAISAGVTDYLQKKSGTSQYRILANRIENAVERNEAREQAAEAELKLKQIAENADDILWMYTADWEELLFINSAYEAIWGRSIDELREYPPAFQRGVHPDDRAITRDAMDRLSDGESIDIEFRVNAAEDFSRWVWVKGYPVLDEQGEAYRVAGFARDITARKAREQRQTRQQDRFKFALDATESYMFEIDFESGREARFGDWEALHGIDQAEAPTTDAFIERAVHPADRDRVRELHDSLDLTPGASMTFDYRAPPEDGETSWFRAEIGVREGADDGLMAIGLATDVTDLQQERHRLEALFENSIDAIVRCEFEDGVPIIRAVNSAFEETFGVSEAEALGQSLDDLVVPDQETKREEAAALNRRIESGERVQTEIRRQTADGVREFLVQSTPLNHGSGSYAIYTDISDRKRRERELERYESIIQALGDPVYALNREGEYTFVNDAFVTSTGYERADIIGSHVSKVVPEQYIEKGQEVIRSLLDDGERQTATWRLERRTADGRLVPTENHIALILDDGQFVGTAGVLRDVTARAAREQQLQRQRDQYEEFAKLLSHDLANPLSVAEGRLELAAAGGGSDDLQAARAALDRMRELIDSVLDLAKARGGVGTLEPVALAECVDDAWETVDTAGGELVNDADQRVLADRSQLRRLFENLLKNAVEHASGPVTVRIGMLPDGFFLEDTGPGIPADEREAVFEPGYTNGEAGNGLGLSIVRDVAEAHGWEIELTASQEDGARFEIRDVAFPE